MSLSEEIQIVDVRDNIASGCGHVNRPDTKKSSAFNRRIAVETVLVSACIWCPASIIRAFISMQHVDFNTILVAVSLCNKRQIGVWSET